MSFEKYRKNLLVYLPENSINEIINFFDSSKVQLKINKERRTKLGDFCPNIKGICRITINSNLDKTQFLITLLHEIAHYNVWEKTKSLKNPHGILWKNEYFSLLDKYINFNSFPDNINKSIYKAFKIKNSNISFNKNIISKACCLLEPNNSVHLSDIPLLSSFVDFSGNQFQVLEKRRTRFLCKNIKTNKLFLVHELYKIKSVIEKINYGV